MKFGLLTPHDHPLIKTKWIFKNKLDESWDIIKKKARLVAQGYGQGEGIDYEKTFAIVAKHESITILLTFAC